MKREIVIQRIYNDTGEIGLLKLNGSEINEGVVITKLGQNWLVIDVKTGKHIACGKTRKLALEELNKRWEKYLQFLNSDLYKKQVESFNELLKGNVRVETI